MTNSGMSQINCKVCKVTLFEWDATKLTPSSDTVLDHFLREHGEVK